MDPDGVGTLMPSAADQDLEVRGRRRAVRLGLLQGFRVECPGGDVQLPFTSQRVLAFLALQAGTGEVEHLRRLPDVGGIRIVVGENRVNGAQFSEAAIVHGL